MEMEGRAEQQQPSSVGMAEHLAALRSLARVSACLVMCAPRFPDGSEGALAVAEARASLSNMRKALKKKGGDDGQEG